MERKGEKEDEMEVLAGQLFRELTTGVGGDLHNALQREQAKAGLRAGHSTSGG